MNLNLKQACPGAKTIFLPKSLGSVSFITFNKAFFITEYASPADSALLLDEGEVETVAHYTAAAFFEPGVDCILDIGGQDMKCIFRGKVSRGSL